MHAGPGIFAASIWFFLCRYLMNQLSDNSIFGSWIYSSDMCIGIFCDIGDNKGSVFKRIYAGIYRTDKEIN